MALLNGPPTVASDEVTPLGVPFAPVNVAAMVRSGGATVFWDPPPVRTDGTPGDNGSPISGYEVQVYANADEPPIKALSSGPDATIVAVEDLENGVGHSFRVRALNAVGSGPLSDSTGSATSAGKPFPPENVAAQTAGDQGTANLTWSPPSDRPDGTPGDNWSTLTGYKVLISPPCSACTGTAVEGDQTSTVVTGLSMGANYSFRVVAKNAFGQSDPSASAEIAFSAGPPSTPTGVVAEWISGSSIKVVWGASNPNGSPVTGYTVISSPGNRQVTTATTSAEFTSMDSGLAHTFQVRATNEHGDSPMSAPSAPVSLATAPPQAPTSVKARRQERTKSATVEWTLAASSTSQATGFRVDLFRVNDDLSSTLAEQETVDMTDEAHFPLVPRGRYYAVVVAINSAGEASSLPSAHFGVWDSIEAKDWQFDLTLSQFLTVRSGNAYPYSFDSDGCSFPSTIPDDSPLLAGRELPESIVRFGEIYDPRFKNACKRHDFGYQNLGRRLHISQNEPTRNDVDDQFLRDMQAICDANSQWNGPACYAAADLYTDAVQVFAGDAFHGSENWKWDDCPDNSEYECEDEET